MTPILVYVQGDKTDQDSLRGWLIDIRYDKYNDPDYCLVITETGAIRNFKLNELYVDVAEFEKRLK